MPTPLSAHLVDLLSLLRRRPNATSSASLRLLAVFLLAGASVSVSACDKTRVGPCLSIEQVPQPDQGNANIVTNNTASSTGNASNNTNTSTNEVTATPCLEPMPRPDPEVDVGPCLSEIEEPEEPGDRASLELREGSLPAGQQSKRALFGKLRARLPADLQRRLADELEPSSEG